MRPEHRFSKALKAALEGMGVLVLPIETGPTNRGVPDLYIALNGRHAWVELKVITPGQKKEPRTAIQVKRQAEMIHHKIRVFNAHNVRSAQDMDLGYRLDIHPGQEYRFVYDLARGLADLLES